MSCTRITVDVPDQLKDLFVAEFSSDDVAGMWENLLPVPATTRMIVFVASSSDSSPYCDRIRHLFEQHAYPNPDVSMDVEETVDWTLEWRKGFTSFPIGRTFRLVPSWEEPEKGDSRVPIGIDPGQAFGTGAHETTQMVLEALEGLESVDGRVVDLGTGSGILAIAAGKLGHGPVVACDVDGDAIRVAADNMVRNLADVGLFRGSIDALASESVYLVLANLTRSVIAELLPEIDRTLMPPGLAILSGILDNQAAELRGVLTAHGYDIQEEMTRGEWVALVVRRHGN